MLKNKLIVKDKKDLKDYLDSDGNLIFDGNIEFHVSIVIGGYISTKGGDIYTEGGDITAFNLKLRAIIHIKGLYKYEIICMVTLDNHVHVKMGCFLRTKEEWDDDFWNNDREFPNNGSIQSRLR